MSRYKPGQSGNPTGKPKGAKDKRTALRELLNPHAEGLVNKAVDLALGGDTTALRLCLERLMPPIKARTEAIELEPHVGSMTEQASEFINKMIEGVITPEETNTLLQTLLAQSKIIEFDELDKRVKLLEESKLI